ncbi:MAG: VCBS repeat-containing protein [Verrucomicrobia bacterium]|nr:VCBS repeat-containing protein [Verrucomicrobiota bacterium]
MDFNGDGKLDLVVDCPDKPYNGVYVFENPGVDTAKNTLPVFKPGRRISKGLQFAGVSFVDGRPRVLTPATEYPDFLTSGLEAPKKLGLPVNIHPKKVRGNSWRYVDFDGDGKMDLVVGADDWTEYGWDNAYTPEGKWTNGPLRGFVYFIRNTGSTAKPVYDKPVKVMAGGKPVETFGWPSPCFADFKGNGKLDLICGEFLDGFTYFENIGTRSAPKYAPGRRLTLPADVAADVRRLHSPPAWLAEKESQSLVTSAATGVKARPLTMDLEMITPTAMDWNQDGRPDLIVGDEDGRVAFIENTGKFTAADTPQFLPPVYFKQEADDLKCGALATPVGVDWDGDGAMDIISGNSAGYLLFFKNLSGPGVEKPKWAAPKYLEADGQVIRPMAGANGSIQGPAEAKWGYTTLSVADWDGDGLPDILLNSILGKVVWFKNVGTRKSPKLAAAQPIEVEWNGPQPALAWGWLRPEGKALLTQWRTTPFAVDLNHDGLMDLVMLDQEGYLAFFERAKRGGKLVLLPPRRVLCDEQGGPLKLSKGTAGKSGRRKICIVDWDGDGKLDILLNSSSANFLRQVDARDGKWFFKDMGALVQQNIEGHDVSPTVVDFNGDGIPDFLGGAEDGRFYYLKNPRAAK